MKTTKTVNEKWDAYDKAVAACHLANYGVIYLDQYGHPVDVEELEYMLEG